MPVRRIKRKGFLFDLYEWMEKHCVEFLDDDEDDYEPGDRDKILSSKKTRRRSKTSSDGERSPIGRGSNHG